MMSLLKIFLKILSKPQTWLLIFGFLATHGVEIWNSDSWLITALIGSSIADLVIGFFKR